MPESAPRRLFSELRRRRVFNTVALYIVGAWVALQAADLAFPGMDVPEGAIRYVWIAAIALFPLVLVFAWRYDVSATGIARTPGADADESAASALQRPDHLLIGGMGVIALAVIAAMGVQIQRFEAPPGSGPPANSIAVLNFAWCGEGYGDLALAGGIHGAVIDHLAAYERLKVTGRNSMYQAAALPFDQMFGALRVQYLLSGELCRDGAGLILRAELSDRDQALVWSDTFHQEADRNNRVERDLATLVANGVALELGEVVTPPHSVPVNARALELLRSGQHHRSQGNVEAAREAFEEALEYEPEYAEALFEMALITADSVDSVVGGIEEAWPTGQKALALARSEIDRGVIDYKPHWVIAKILMTMAQWDKGLTWRTAAKMDEAEIAARKAAALSMIEEAEQHLRVAVRLNPSDIGLRRLLVRVLELQGPEKRGEALANLEHGRLTEPLDPFFIGYLANQLNNRGQYQQAMDEIERFRRDFGMMTPYLLWQQLEIQTKAHRVDDKLATCIEILRNEPELFEKGSLRMGHFYWLATQVAWLGLPDEGELLNQAFRTIPTVGDDPMRRWLPESTSDHNEEATEKLLEIESLSNEEILDRGWFEAGQYINAIWNSGDLERTVELVESMRHFSYSPLWAQQAHGWLLGLASLYMEVGRPSAAIPVLEEAA